jgi:competence protein ComEC
MLDVGQGDSFLIQTTTGKQMLIDGGKDATVLAELARLLPVGDRSIDVVLATHPDMDHIGGLDEVLKRYKVGLFLTSAVGTDTKEYVSLLELLKAKQIEPIVARQGMKITFSDTESFTVLFPDRDVTGWESNSGSVIGVFAAGEQRVLFTGDAPASVEQYLVATIPKQLDVDIVKLGHHGSRTSTTAALLKAATPELALISAGKDNSYGHPHKEVLTLLQQFAIPFVSTQDTGTVTLETDGATWRRGEK